MTRGPSPFLSWSELACKDAAKTPYPHAWRATRAMLLAREFERIRIAIGAPIRVGSAYRTPEHNRAVGGAANSQHMQGRALDLYPPDGWSVAKFYAAIREIAGHEESSIGGLGRYPTFVHIDTRPIANGRLTVWSGNRAWAELK